MFLAQSNGLAAVDWFIIAAYAIGTLWLGWWFGKRQSNSAEYFTGSGRMNSVLIGVSLFATLLSTISYLSFPGEAIGKGPAFLAQLIGYPIIFVAAAYWLLPVYKKYQVLSAYELLEERLGRRTRLLGGGMFILLRLVWMSTLIYFAATALAVIFGVTPKWEPLIVLIAGMIAVGYTTLGGLRAVVITDAIQTVLLYSGAVLVIVMISVKMGGFGWFPTEWHPQWDYQPVMSFDPAVRVSMIGAMISMVVWYVATIGGDQVSVQRFMATEDLKAARKSIATNLTVGAVVKVTLLLAGFALLGYYGANPGELGGQLSLKGNADKIFPHFIAGGLPPVISGLVVAAVCAAAMSSIDSGVNSITAVVVTDFLPGKGDRNEREKMSAEAERGQIRLARILAVVIGLIVISTSALVKFVPGNITAITGKTVNLLPPHIFALFFFALFVKSAKPAGVWLGCAAGTISAVLIGFSGPIFGYRADTGTDPVSFIWMAPVSLAVNLAVGWLACRFLPSKRWLSALAVAVLAVFLLGLLTIWRPSMRIRLDEATRAKAEGVLRDGLRSNEFWPAMHAAEGLTIGGRGGEVREFLEPKLGDPQFDDQERCGLARELVRAGDLEKGNVLYEILTGEDDFGHVHAAESIYKTTGIRDGAALRRAFQSDGSIKLRLMAAGALAKAGDAEAMAFLRKSMESAESETYKIAAWLLGRIGSGEEDIPLLRARLDDAGDPLLRAYLQHSLAALGDKKGLAALRANLSSDDPDIRTYAATFAGDARAISAAPRLMEMLDDPDLDARIRAAQSLLDLANRKEH